MTMESVTASRFDVAAYFDRLGFRGSPEPTLTTLEALHALHPAAIAFENIDVFAGGTAALDGASLERKLVHDRRGGWCFEQNLLLGGVLAQIGFPVRQLAARVLWNAPPGAVRPRTHMLLLVDIDSRRFIADVGFGGLTATAPLALEAGVEQTTSHETFRILRAGEEFLLQARVLDEWKSLYVFDLQAQTLADYEMANWYLTNHPQSSFRHHLTAARVAPGCRYALFDDELAIHRTGAASERRMLPDVDALRGVLVDEFGIRLPGSTALDAAFARIFERRRS